MPFVGVDWGTTNLRAYLVGDEVDGTAALLEERTGPGITAVADRDFAGCLATVIEPWLDTADTILVSGMASSTLGWLDVPYTDCPTDLPSIATGAEHVTVAGRSARLIGGVRTRNPLGLNDVMRGEELQTFGALPAGVDQALVILPGTHNKWVSVSRRRIDGFFTALTGETFALLRHGSILVPDVAQEHAEAAFDDGVALSARHGAERLLTLLFSVRARQLSGDLDAAHSAAYLSGLLVGADVASGLATARQAGWDTGTIFVVGDSALCTHYVAALAHHCRNAEPIDAARAGLLGYARLRTALENRQ